MLGANANGRYAHTNMARDKAVLLQLGCQVARRLLSARWHPTSCQSSSGVSQEDPEPANAPFLCEEQC